MDNGAKKHRSLAERVADIEHCVRENNTILRQLIVSQCVLLAALDYPAAATEIHGMQVRLPPRTSSAGIILPGAS